jgi:hypothetical protein
VIWVHDRLPGVDGFPIAAIGITWTALRCEAFAEKARPADEPHVVCRVTVDGQR